MNNEAGLADAVDEFLDRVGKAIEPLRDEIFAVSAEELRHKLIIEAHNLSAAFIDCDERHSELEVVGFMEALGKYLPDLIPADLSVADVRDAQLLDNKRKWLDEPSGLFSTLVRVDGKRGSQYSSVYYEHAMRVAHTVIGLDEYTSRLELSAVEQFRSMLLRSIKSGGVSGNALSAMGAIGDSEKGIDPTIDMPPERPLDELLAELDELIGLDAVKEEVKLVAALLRVQQIRADRGLETTESSRHLVFVGNPGTGKSTVARLLAQIYRTLGVVERGHLIETDRAGLVAGFVGQTATKVTETFDRADQGVLIIDEAYSLVRGGERDFGREAIDSVVKLVEDRRDSVVVIMAGYPDEMAQLIDANPGLKSRFPKTISFPDYDDDELLKIFEIIATKNHFSIDDSAREAVAAFFASADRGKGFGNGRAARNLFEAAVARQAVNLSAMIEASQEVTDEVLTTLGGADIPTPDDVQALGD